MNRLAKRAALLLSLSLPFSSANATEAMMHGEEGPLFHSVRFQIDGAQNDQGGLISWEGNGFIGGDLEKLVVRTEGESQNGHVERSEVWGLYSRNVTEFWDVQAGIRQDLDPRPQTFLAIGIEGLAPYFIETGAHAFLAKNGDLSARLEQSIDLLITQSIALKPHLKLDASANDAPEGRIGAGLSRLEMGAQLRYEITRKFAPYIDLVYERALGNTARMIREDGSNPGDLTLRAGISLSF